MKEIQIIRRETADHLPVPVTANSKKYLSSVYKGRGPLRGLGEEEEKRLLSRHLGMDKDERDFHKVVRDFWANLRVEVPTEGVVLNVTTTKDKDSGIENPVEIEDYVIFKWAKRHPLVADNRQEMLKDSKYLFYIRDPEVETEFSNQKVRFKKKAYEEFIKMGDDEDKMNRMIRLLSDSDPSDFDLKQKQNFIDDIIENDPEKFFVVSTDKHLETKALISEMVSEGIINKIGNQHYFIDEKLGETVDETVKYFNDKKNSETVNILKAKLQESKR